MVNYEKELGNDLTKILIAVKNSPNITLEDLAVKLNISENLVKDYVESLQKRGYINSTRKFLTDSGESRIVYGTFWKISVDGLNYLDLHRRWYKRFFVRSVLCPLIVSFVTSLVTVSNAENILKFFKSLF